MALRRTKEPTGRHTAGESAATAVAETIVPEQSPVARPEDWTRLGDLLVQRSRVSHKQVAEALLQQSASGKRIGRLLVDLGGLSDRELAQALAEQMQLALVDLAQEQPDPGAIPRLPEAIARGETVVPMLENNGTLVVAVAEPSESLGRQLMAASGMPVTMVVAPSSDIRRAIDASYRALTDIDSHVLAFQQAEAGRSKVSAKASAADAASVAATIDAP